MDPIYAMNGTAETFRPMTYISWRAENLTTTETQSADRTLALVGEAEGGQPGRQYLIPNLQVAESLFRAGPLLDAVRLAMETGDLPFGRIRAVNVKPGTRSSLVLKDAANKTFGTVFRNAWRERANQTSLSLAGSAASGYAVALRDADTGLTLSSNNLGLGLRIQYQGSSPTATVSITTESGVKVLRTQLAAGQAGEVLMIPLSGGLTVRELCERINRSGPYNAYPARDAALVASGLDTTTAPVNIAQYNTVGNVQLAAGGATSLTFTAPVTIAQGTALRLRSTTGTWFTVSVTVAATAATNVSVSALPLAIDAGVAYDAASRPAVALSALKADFGLFFSTRGDSAFDFQAGADATAGAPVAVSAYFGGGSSDATTFSDWMLGLEALAELPVSIITPITDNQAIVAGFRSHVNALNAPDNGRFVQLIAGYDTARLPRVGATTAEVDDYVREVGSEASAANSRDMVLIGATQSFLNAAGQREQVSLPLMAAHIAGLAAAYGPDTSLTYANTNGTGAFPRLSRSQTNQLTRSGVLCIETVGDTGAARIVRDRTTYVGVSNAVYESGYGVRKMNAIARGAKDIQDRNVPGASGKARLAKYRADLENYYERQVERGWIEAGVMKGRPVPAFSVQVNTTGAGGRQVRTLTRVNLVLEFLVGEQEIVATTAEFEI